MNPLEFTLIQQNYDAVDNLEKDVKNDIAWLVDTKQLLMELKMNLVTMKQKMLFQMLIMFYLINW